MASNNMLGRIVRLATKYRGGINKMYLPDTVYADLDAAGEGGAEVIAVDVSDGRMWVRLARLDTGGIIGPLPSDAIEVVFTADPPRKGKK